MPPDVVFLCSPKQNNLSVRLTIGSRTATGADIHQDAHRWASAIRDAAELLLAAVEQSDSHGQSAADLPLVLDGFSRLTDFRFLSALARLQKERPMLVHGCRIHAKAGRAEILIDPKDPKRLLLAASIDGRLVSVEGSGALLFGTDELWAGFTAQGGLHLCRLDTDHPGVLESLSVRCRAPIPASFISTFIGNTFYDAGRLGRVRLADAQRLDSLRVAAVPRMYLREDAQAFAVELRFSYADHEIPPGVNDEYLYREGTVLLIERDYVVEDGYAARLLDSGLSRSGDRYVPVIDPSLWLSERANDLVRHGFEVYGRERIMGAEVLDGEMRMHVRIGGETDWFDLRLEARVGDTDVPLRNLVEALLGGERFVRLGDGRLGTIPDKVLKRLSEVMGLLERTDQGLRATKQQAAIVQELVAVSDTSELSGETRSALARDVPVAQQKIPDSVQATLRPYQQEGYDWLCWLIQTGSGGILADDMGLGKTLQVLSLLERERLSGKGPCIVVVPTSLVFNWEREAQKFVPRIRIHIHHGDRPQTKEDLDAIDADLWITTYNTYRQDSELLKEVRFHLAVLDESQYIKNPQSQTSRALRGINAKHRLAMTGTPVENSSIELWSQFAFVSPGFLGSEAQFRRVFAKHIEERGDEERASRLRAMIRPFILRRTKENVAKDLPPKQVVVELCEMEDQQRAMYDALKQTIRDEVELSIARDGVSGSQVRILQGLLRLRQLANLPSLVDQRLSLVSGKFETLCANIEEAVREGHKVLVFSTFIPLLHELGRRLSLIDIRYAYLDGSTDDRQGAVREFQEEDGVKAFLISLRAGGVGLTLTAADYVFIVDPWWNPAVERQAIDRAHRIGQDRPVFVYKLISKDTVEEKILKMQEAKTALLESLVDEGVFLRRLNEDDVRFLFS